MATQIEQNAKAELAAQAATHRRKAAYHARRNSEAARWWAARHAADAARAEADLIRLFP